MAKYFLVNDCRGSLEISETTKEYWLEKLNDTGNEFHFTDVMLFEGQKISIVGSEEEYYVAEVPDNMTFEEFENIAINCDYESWETE